MLFEHNIQFIQGQVNKEINIIGTKPLDYCQLSAHKHLATQAKGIARLGRWEEKERNKKLPARTPGIICMELPTRTSGGAK